jgi:hypothetical protein
MFKRFLQIFVFANHFEFSNSIRRRETFLQSWQFLMNRLLISEINEIESINWDEYENVQIFQSVDSFFIFTHSLFIVFSQNREITLLVDRQISRIRRIEFYREKDKKIEFNKFCRFDLDQIHIFLNIITFNHRLDNHDSFISVVELLKN